MDSTALQSQHEHIYIMTMLMKVTKMKAFTLYRTTHTHTHRLAHLHCPRILGLTTALATLTLLGSTTDRIRSSQRYSNQYQEYGSLLSACRGVKKHDTSHATSTRHHIPAYYVRNTIPLFRNIRDDTFRYPYFICFLSFVIVLLYGRGA